MLPVSLVEKRGVNVRSARASGGASTSVASTANLTAPRMRQPITTPSDDDSRADATRWASGARAWARPELLPGRSLPLSAKALVEVVIGDLASEVRPGLSGEA